MHEDHEKRMSSESHLMDEGICQVHAIFYFHSVRPKLTAEIVGH